MPSVQPVYFDQQAKAHAFTAKWLAKATLPSICYESRDTHNFLSELIDVVNTTGEVPSVDYETPVSLGKHHSHPGRIDAYIGKTQVLIELKSSSHDLDQPLTQSDGTVLTPYEQVVRYAKYLPASYPVRFILVSNFIEFRLYDLTKERAHPEKIAPKIISLQDFEQQFERLAFLVDPARAQQEDPFLAPSTAISINAGRRIAQIYQQMLPLYKAYKGDKPEEALQSLNNFCVRLVFCWYASSAHLFDAKAAGPDLFKAYFEGIPAKCGWMAFTHLFHALNLAPEQRDPHEAPELLGLPWVDGGLFEHTEQDIIPQFNAAVWQLITAEHYLNWSMISPTIFGAVFESTMNPETRRLGGMHYTAVENIHKVINPLFLNDLKADFASYQAIQDKALRHSKLEEFQNKLASLTFLDPACGSGNFLTETFVCLRRLENQVIRELYADQAFLGIAELNPVKVNLRQFVGIEINDFAVKVAQTALWIAESQMLAETSAIINHPIEPFPLHNYDNIVQSNALTTPWEQVVPLEQLSYIIGNPPFSGARMMEPLNKQHLRQALGDKWPTKGGDLDFVCGWFKKAHDVMCQAPHIKTAFVATNSICQGSAVANLWQPLLEGGSEIIFAHHSFLWDSEAPEPASVYCAIVGFANKACATKAPKLIFEGAKVMSAEHINAYLLDAPDAFVREHSKPLCSVPEGRMGNQPIDDGNYLFTAKEKDDFLKHEPQAAPYFHRWYGSRELLQGKERYCLYLGSCSEADLAQMPEARQRVEAVRQYRLQSKAASTRKLAANPTQFNVTCLPTSRCLAVPEVSSYRRAYLPLAFMQPEDGLCSNKLKLFPEAHLYHFSVLSSTVHMVWVKTVAGRLKMDFDYSTDLVYNSFPWPQKVKTKIKHKLEKAAQAILNARAAVKGATLAELYDPEHMPKSLRQAHAANDRLVMQAYGFDKDWSEAQIFSALYQLYQQLTGQKTKARTKP